jgi:hypothetical protein
LNNLVPAVIEQLRGQVAGGIPHMNFSYSTHRGSSSFPSQRARGRGGYSGYGGGRGGNFTASFPPSFPPPFQSQTIKCYLCATPHLHRDHEGNARRLVRNELGKWIDKALNDRIVCVTHNVSPHGCKRGPICFYSHSCSLCGDLSHGSWKCNA